MNKVVVEKRRFSSGNLLTAGLLLLTVNSAVAGNTQWWLTSMAQTYTGKYIFESNSQTNYLSLGLMGRGDRWALSINVPYIYQQYGSYTQINEVVVTADGMGQNDNGGMHGGSHNQDPEPDEIILVEGIIKPRAKYGIGDIYLFGNIKMLGKTHSPSGIFLNTQIKVPVANFEKGLSSGEFDYGLSLSYKKIVKTFNIFSDIGYLVLGDLDEFEYIDPLIWGAGVGKAFNGGQIYTMIYYQQYSKIIDGYEPPRQLSLGIYHKVKPSMIIALTGIKGFGEISPDVGLRGSIQWKIN